MPHHSVEILMATYNGERYLEEQIASLQGQTYADWQLLVSDDGSSDHTVGLLERLAKEDERIVMLDDDAAHRGACGRFFWLLAQSHADYVLFSDQDDVWDARKVEVLLNAARREESVAGKDLPIVVFCDAEVVGSDLSPIDPSLMAFENYDAHADELRQLLVCNIAPGCTMLVNRALIDALLLPEDLSTIIMHDWWLMLVGAALGRIVYVDEALVKYRQHDTNTEGVKGYSVTRYLAQMERVARAHLRCQRQAAAFSQAYGTRLSARDLAMCQEYGTVKTYGIKPIRTIVRYRLWQPGFARRVGQIVLRLVCHVTE